MTATPALVTMIFLWSNATALGSRVEFFNPWDRTEHSASVISSSEAHYTLCVRSFTSEFEDSSKVKLFNSLSSSGGASDKSIKSEDTDERYYWTEDFAEDKKQNLIWQRKDAGEKTFPTAKLHCSMLDHGGFGWRLPSVGELRNLFEVKDSSSKTKTEIFQKLRFGNYWSTSEEDSEARSHNPWNGSGSKILIEELEITLNYTVCVKNSVLFQRGIQYASYQKLKSFSREAIGCGFLKVGCSDDALKFPDYQSDFHVKGYRRVNLWSNEPPWTDTRLRVKRGDAVYFMVRESYAVFHMNSNAIV